MKLDQKENSKILSNAPLIVKRVELMKLIDSI